MEKIRFFFNKLLATFWFVPLLIISFSIFLAIGLVSLDQGNSLSYDGIGRFFFVNSADSARSILATLSGAMIGVAGTVFSVTLVVLTLASSQFGPRLITNFMYVRLNQVVLGSYISTYLYCLLVLNAIKETNGETFTPALSILVAIIAALVNIILLIVFIHQMAISIQADKVIADISAIINRQIKTLFPTKMGNEPKDENALPAKEIKSKYNHKVPIKSPKSGYLQYIDNTSLLEAVCSCESLIELHFRPGNYVVEDIEIGTLYTNSSMDEEQLKHISDQFVIGQMKNAQQDLEFSIHQMVEIAARALSPGINDPYTAMACIDNLTSTLCQLAQVNFPSRYRIDDENNLRIIVNISDFEGFLDASFNQIRQFSAGIPAVIIRLMDALVIIDGFVKNDAQKRAVIKHAKMVLNSGKESIKEEFDLRDLQERAKKIVST